MIEHEHRKSLHLEEERLIAGSVHLADNTWKTDFIIPEMRCAGCIRTLENGLAHTPPVISARANLSLKTISVVWDPERGSPLEISRQINALGFDNHLAELETASSHGETESRRLLTALGVAGFAAANIMLLSVSVWSGADEATAQLFHLISGVIAVPAVAIAGQPFFRSALKALSAKRLNMDVPISLAVVLALLMSLYEGRTGGHEAYFDASVTLLFFLLIGRYLDTLMRQKARAAVERLATLSAKTGILVSADGETRSVPLADIAPGMVLRVFPGERFPVDGTICHGKTHLDRSHVTGESEAVAIGAGERVEAGTLNLASTIDFETTSDARTSFLGEMQRMMAEAENGRSSYIRVADRMASIYAPAVHLLALIAFTGWMVVTGGDWHTSLYIAIAVLIITCPCALGLAVPVAHVISANRLMQNGIMMRDGTGIERLAEIDTVFFDKTGTLTNGKPEVQQVHGLLAEKVALLRAMAGASTHPAAHAVLRHMGEGPKDPLDASHEVAGKGVEAEISGKRARLGQSEWVSEIAHDGACTTCHSVSFAIEGENAVHFDIADSLRQDAETGVDSLRKMGLDLEIISGDLPAKVAHVASLLGIQHFHGRQSPADKIDLVTTAREKGHQVLMVGDGINDGPALAAGNVSMVPASASDVGRQASDFVFTRPSLTAIAFAVSTARFTSKVVRQNFAIAIAYNCIAVPLAMAGHVTPLIAALAMSGSSIVVVANSFRIHFADDPAGVSSKGLKDEMEYTKEEALQTA
jgi:Cu2+-exporting ATPase